MHKGKIALALGFPSKEEESKEPDADDEKKAGSKAETLAMKAFMKAEDAESKAEAMRDFLEACGLY